MRYILDVDPGHDDMLMILLAAQHLEIAGITTVAGNQSLDKVTSNALKILELAGLERVPVAKGMGASLLRRMHYEPKIHGKSGLDGYEFPDPTTSLHPSHGVDFIIDQVMNNQDIAVIATGPFTNLATAIMMEPRIIERIPLLSVMGGSVTFGNATAAAEFNIFADPEAADIVFRSGIPIKMFGLNVTRQAGASEAHIERMRALGNEVGRAAADLLEFFLGALRQRYGLDTASLHDACAAAVLIDPDLFTLEPMHVAVELNGELTRGMTVCDYRFSRLWASEGWSHDGHSTPRPNAEVATAIDSERFMELVIDALSRY